MALGNLASLRWTSSKRSLYDFFATTDGGRVWAVSGRNGENLIRAEGASEAEAWHRAVDQAQSVGMLEGIIRGNPGLS